MAAATKASVKSNFETGDIPTQTQFGELIDSYTDFSDTLLAISSAAGDRGRTGIVEVIATANVTLNAVGGFGRRIIGAGTTAAAADMLNVISTDGAQTITGLKNFQGLRVSGKMTVVSDSPTAILMVGTDTTAGSVNAPVLAIQREYNAGDWHDDDATGGVRWAVQPSAAAAQYTLANMFMSVQTALTSATDARIAYATRVGSGLVSQMSIGGSAGGVSLVSAAGGTINPLGTGTLNSDRLYSHDARQVTPHQQAFAWASHTGTGTVSLSHSINIASITDNGTGDYSLVFSTAASNTTYGVQVYAGTSSGSTPPTAPIWTYVAIATAGGCRYGVLRGTVGASALDTERITVTVWDAAPTKGTRVP